MGRVQGMHGKREVHTIFWWGEPDGREGLEDLDVAGG